MTSNQTILILGGTGFVGRALCATLARESANSGSSEGLKLRVPTRRLAHAQALSPLPIVEVLEASVHNDKALDALLAGCDAVVNLIAILHGSAADFEAVHVHLPQRLAAACQRAGVRRLLQVSALGVGSNAPSNYLRSKTRGETVLQAAGLDLTILRPSVIFGAEDRFLNLFARLQALAPVVPLAGAGSQYQPVWVDDVAEALSRCLADPRTIGQIYECVGPDVKTLAELVRMAGAAAGHVRPVFPLPDFLARLQAWAMELAPGEPLMSRDNLDSMRTPNIATGRLPGLEALGITATSLQAVLPLMFDPMRGTGRLEAWRSKRR